MGLEYFHNIINIINRVLIKLFYNYLLAKLNNIILNEWMHSYLSNSAA